MTTLTNQENITNINNNDNNKVENKENSQSNIQAKNSKLHIFLSNISNKLGLSNAIYFK
ncbi:MAG: hypothetical protein ACI9LM_003545 [Alteromonadaceae bacterium]|jgi:hypothetical protein